MTDAGIHPKLASLALRPPTPPRERSERAKVFAEDDEQFAALTQGILPDTPNGSPSSSAENSVKHLAKVTKRVGFSPWTEYHGPASIFSKSLALHHQTTSLLPSKECKPSKSILKSTSSGNKAMSTANLSTASQNGDVNVMLQSTIQHLSENSLNSRIDAYSSLVGCLSAYGDVPGLQNLAARLLDLLGFIRRDIQIKIGANTLESQLVTRALRVLMFLSSIESLANLFPGGFCSLVIEQAILTLEHQNAPKLLVVHYMQLLSQQKFAPQHMTSERTGRLILALDLVADRTKGNRVISLRLMVYQRLLSQAKQSMIAHVRSWIDHLIAGTLSTYKEIRSYAIAFGIEAGLSLGTSRTVSQACIDTMNRQSPDGRKVVDFLESHLTAMINAKEDGVHIPQIWSIIVLFLRSRGRQLERWEHFKPWLMIIQKCFNSSNTHIRFQANVAWSRLIFAVNPDTSTSSSMIKTLRQPIVAQLERKLESNTSKVSGRAKEVARSSYCTLLYYAFRPLASHSQCDLYWEEYVSQILPISQPKGSPDIDFTCTVLTALFRCPKSIAWEENRANLERPLKTEELPCLDPKWIRYRAATILRIFEELLLNCQWDSKNDRDLPIISAWQNFTTAIGEAGKKEVKTSMLTINAIAHMLNVLKQFLQEGLRHSKSQKSISPIFVRFGQLVDIAVEGIGSIAFNEVRISQNSNNLFEAVEAPSSRCASACGPLTTGIVSLSNLLILCTNDDQVNNDFQNVLEGLVNLALRPATSKHQRISILRDLSCLVLSSSSPFLKPKSALWRLTAKAVGTSLDSADSSAEASESHEYHSQLYKNAVKVLEIALVQQSDILVAEWQALSSVIIRKLEDESNEDAIATLLLEPLIDTIQVLLPTSCNEFILAVAACLLENIRWSHLQQGTHRGTKVLPNKLGNKNLSSRLFSMIDSLLNESYMKSDSIPTKPLLQFILAVTNVLLNCPSAPGAMSSKHLQRSLGCWIQDEKGVVSQESTTSHSATLHDPIKNLWVAVLSSMESHSEVIRKSLPSVEPFIIFGFKSRHRAILDATVSFWNRYFGSLERLQYSETLRSTLVKLRPSYVLRTPGLPEKTFEAMSLSTTEAGSQSGLEESQPHQMVSPDNPSTKISREAFETVTPTKAPKSNPPDLLKTPSIIRTSEKHIDSTPRARLGSCGTHVPFSAIDSSPLKPRTIDLEVLADEHNEVKERPNLSIVAPVQNFVHPSRSEACQTDKDRDTTPKSTAGSLPQILDSVEGSTFLSLVNAAEQPFGSSPTPSMNGKNRDYTPSSQAQRSASPTNADLMRKRAITPSTPNFRPGKDEKQRQNQHTNVPHSIIAIPTDSTLMNNNPKRNSYSPVISQSGDPPEVHEIDDTSEQSDACMRDISSNITARERFDVFSKPMPVTKACHIEQGDFHAQVTQKVGDLQPSEDLNAINMESIATEAKPSSSVILETESTYEYSKEIDTGKLRNEDDQIRAQLVSDLQRASTSPIRPTKPTKKRKISGEASGSPVKKFKGRQQPRKVHVVIETGIGEGRERASIVHSEEGTSQPISPRINEAKPKSHSKTIEKTAASRRSSRRTKRSVLNDAASTISYEASNVTTSANTTKSTFHEDSAEMPAQQSSHSAGVASVEGRDDRFPGSSQAEGSRLDDSTSAGRTSRNTECPGQYDARGGSPWPGARNSDRHQSSSNDMSDGLMIPQAFLADSDEVAMDLSMANSEPSNSDLSLLPLDTQSSSLSEPVEKGEAEPHEGTIGGVQADVGDDLADEALRLPPGSESGSMVGRTAGASVASILDGFRALLGNIPKVRFDVEEERQLIGLLFESMQAVHEAGRRTDRSD